MIRNALRSIAVGATFVLASPLGAQAAADGGEAPRLQISDVSTFAAMLATAENVADMGALVLRAHAAGLTDIQIAVAFGLAWRISATPDVVKSAFGFFKSGSKAGDDALDKGFQSGAAAASNGGAGGGPLGSAPLGKAGLSDKSGGGGASPK